MPQYLSTLARFAGALLLAASVQARAQAAVPSDTPYPGMLTLQVDATDLDRRIFRVRETVPVVPGPLRLYYPQWLPGNHGPTGRIDELAGLKISAGGARLAWKRDPLDVYAFTLEVPSGASTLDIEFQHLSPIDRDSGRVVVTPEMLNVQWNAVLLYPAGHADRAITVKPSLRLPAGWKFGSALEAAAQQGTTTEFKPVSVETLIDSPVFAGKHMARIDLDPDAAANGRAPIFLDVMADTPGELTMTAEQLAAHRALVTQADRLFGTRHFAHYDFLLAISDGFGGIGLEHHQSSENGVPPGYFSEWAKSSVGRDLLAHEFTHSWNGKFRRPYDLWTPDFNTVPEQDDLLWVYEGLTQYYGDVLAARSGLWDARQFREMLAGTIANMASRPGRQWRPLQDTADEASILYYVPFGWANWRRQVDFYPEGELLWLDVDTRIRELSHGHKSLDDFSRAFFGIHPGSDVTVTYTFDDIVKALNGVEPYDWAAFLRQRLDYVGHRLPEMDGVTRSGWKLAYTDKPDSYQKAIEAQRHMINQIWGAGFSVADKDGRLLDVRWDGPAFKAGLAPGMQIVAVNGRQYSAESLRDALTDAATSKQPIDLLVKNLEYVSTIKLDWTGGLMYPVLERLPNTPDYLGAISAARK